MINDKQYDRNKNKRFATTALNCIIIYNDTQYNEKNKRCAMIRAYAPLGATSILSAASAAPNVDIRCLACRCLSYDQVALIGAYPSMD